MIVHVFTQVSDYSSEFLNMLAEAFNADDHVIIFRKKTAWAKPPSVLNIKYLTTRGDMITQMPSLLKEADKIVFHSFPVSRSLLFWYQQKKYMVKAVWSVWGQDAYWFKYCKKNPVNYLYEYIRTRLIRKLDVIFCPIKGDYEYLVSHYQTRARYINGMYPIPTDFEALVKLRNKKENQDKINIQIGNSANPTNNTEQVIRFIAKHKPQNFNVFCPLSYGDMDYANKIIAIGKQELGDHFYPLTNFLDRERYADFISSVDILIMNHQRQQGLGNIFSYLFLGKKVYIRSDNSSFEFFENNGIKVYNTLDLLSSDSLDHLTVPDEDIALSNMSATERLVSRPFIISGWKQIFN